MDELVAYSSQPALTPQNIIRKETYPSPKTNIIIYFEVNFFCKRNRLFWY